MMTHFSINRFRSRNSPKQGDIININIVDKFDMMEGCNLKNNLI